MQPTAFGAIQIYVSEEFLEQIKPNFISTLAVFIRIIDY